MNQDELLRWRRHLHAHPELSFHEHETARFVEETLRSFGLTPTRPVPTGVMARLRKGPGPTLALRADMDALPIQEETDLPFRSQVPGVMHACGHDGHTAILLGVAQTLSEEPFSGEVRFLFQPAEELFPGGAESMVEAGVLEGVDAVLGLHLDATRPSGLIQIKSGPLQAAPDTFEIEIRGTGGHAAYPHLLVDPIAIAAEAILALQQVVSRHNDPLEPLVLSVTQIHGGSADNVIPPSVRLGGTVRSFNEELRRKVPEWMERILAGICQAHGGEYRLHYQRGYRPVVNPPELTERVRAILTDAGFQVEEARPVMGGEDFSAYQARVPGVFFFLGAGGPGYPHHHPRFQIDESSLQVGVQAFVALVRRLLAEGLSSD